VKAGVDAVVLESYEAGGHVSSEQITAITNIPAVARAIDVPLIAAGGIVDGYGMAAALCLGADGVQMGTRFLATEESNAPAVYQRMLLEAGEADVPVHCLRYHPGRALRSPVIDRVLELEKEERPVEEVRAFIGRGRARKAAHQGDVENGIFYAGAGAALVGEVVPVKALFDQLLAEYGDALGRATGLFRPARAAASVGAGAAPGRPVAAE
jgi:enoyl-[acyl-carrier protein] reductase II